MNFQDKILTCSDYDNSFAFSAEEQKLTNYVMEKLDENTSCLSEISRYFLEL
jgi:hypothetical protein